MKYIIVSILLISCNYTPFEIETRKPVYFIGGQSNAKVGIKEGILDLDSSVNIIHQNHSGKAIVHWIDSLLEVDFKHIDNNLSENKYLHSVIWFQGESDTSTDYLVNEYKDRLDYVINEYRNRYGIINFNIILIYGNNFDRDMFDRIEKIREIQMELSNGRYIDSKKYDRIDNWHLANSDYKILGGEVYELLYRQ